MRRSFDVTYEKVDIEIFSSSLFQTDNNDDVRLVLGNYIPAYIMLGSPLLYLFLIKILFPWMRPITENQKERVTKLRQIHNLLLFLYSGFCCLSCFYYLWSSDNNQLMNWNELLCTPVEGTILRPLSVTFTLSKLWEWGDTAFLIWLGKSSPKFLHVYHHATTFLLFCFVMNLPGPEKMGMLLNGGVHTLMYWHYWKPWPKQFVPLITILQISQLAFVTYVYTINANTCRHQATGLSRDLKFIDGPQEYLLEFLTAYATVPVFLVFFIRFFIQRFILKKKKKQPKKEE